MSKEDKVIYDTLVNLREYCNKHSECSSCYFSYKDGEGCNLAKLGKELSIGPYMYNLDEIRRLLEYDIQEDDQKVFTYRP